MDLSKQRGSLHILKTFYNQHLNETVNFVPGYLYEDGSSAGGYSFRVETQGGESGRFKGLFESVSAAPVLGFGNLPTLSKIQSTISTISTGGAKKPLGNQTTSVWEQEDRLEALMMCMRRNDQEA